MWKSLDTIAVVELIIYIPFSLLSLFVIYRQGFRRCSGWFYTFMLCNVRIIGGALQFVSHNDTSTGLLTAILVLDSVGLSPLLLATSGFLFRFVEFINANSTKPTFTRWHFRFLRLVFLTGLVLAIVGGTSISFSADGQVQIPVTTKIGVIVSIVGFLVICLIFFLSVPRTSVVPSKERRVPVAIIFALPFIFVRLLYSILSIFLKNHVFNLANGSVPVRAVMSIMEEIVVVVAYAVLGLFLDKVNKETKGSIPSRPHNDRKHRDRTSADIEAQYLRNDTVNIPLSR